VSESEKTENNANEDETNVMLNGQCAEARSRIRFLWEIPSNHPGIQAKRLFSELNYKEVASTRSGIQE
jgi:hypothetical protein